MQVKLVRYTPEPEKTVAMSARLCYSPIGAAQLEEKISDEQAAALVRKLVSMGHFNASACTPPHCFLFAAVAALC